MQAEARVPARVEDAGRGVRPAGIAARRRGRAPAAGAARGCETTAVIVVSLMLKPAGSVMFPAMRLSESGIGGIAHKAARIASGTSRRHHWVRSRWLTQGKKSGGETRQ